MVKAVALFFGSVVVGGRVEGVLVGYFMFMKNRFER